MDHVKTKRGMPIVLSLLLCACASHLEAPRKAAADLEGSAVVGMSYQDFVKKLQDFAAAIALARQEGASEKALLPYSEAFDIYRDSKTIWQMKIDCPKLFDLQNESCSAFAGFDTIPDMAKKYGVAYPEGSRLPRGAKGGYSHEWITYVEANHGVFDKLLSTIWEKAQQRAKEH
jgi:hypothetical protein